MERFEERKLELSPSDQKKYKANKNNFVRGLLNPLKIKRIQEKDNGKKWIVITQGNYRFVVVAQGQQKAIVKTMTKYNSQKAKRKYI